MAAPLSRVRALLGPTNTGKTHRAVTAMLAHRSGMIGLPLRLLAREVYDRIVRSHGAEVVALVTGEEKRVPPQARFFVCTVEAMPISRRVAFLAVDEIQLAGDRQRGHIFTDRLLHARGTLETWFLGAPTIQPLLEQLLPEAEIETARRFSTLRYAGVSKLTALPKRSAVVAFSAEQVYAQAERLKAAHGGAAVVLGALSPRARNAQVAMYQAGEVHHLVATDAIGMGLNMDVNHVAFSALRKFDGQGFRDLRPSEVGQIAGRAGRYTTDGTFGATRAQGPLPDEIVEAVETHAFAPLARLYWRNSDLDFDSPRALLASLERRPPHPVLRPVRQEFDHHALEALVDDPELLARIDGPDAVARLWEVCGVPDYRKSLTTAHVQLIRELAGYRVAGEPLPGALLEERLDRLDAPQGDIDTLMARIAWVRTWTYVTHQRGWLDDPGPLRERAMAIEDRLSDALHERLQQRFVDRTLLYVVEGRELEGDLTVDGDKVMLGSFAVGELRDLSFLPDPGLTQKKLIAAVRRALSSEAHRAVADLEAVEDDAITVDEEGRVAARGVLWARLLAGPELSRPRLKGRRLELLDPTARERVRVRLQAWLDRYVDSLTAPLRRGARKALGDEAAALVGELEAALGVVDRDQVPAADALGDADRRALARLDVRIGTRTIYVQSLLKGGAQERKAVLWSVQQGLEPLQPAPANGPTSLLGAGAPPHPLLRLLGYRPLGVRWVRADIVERIAAHARDWARAREPRTLDKVMSWLGASPDEARGVVEALGYRLGPPSESDPRAFPLERTGRKRRGGGRRRGNRSRGRRSHDV